MASRDNGPVSTPSPAPPTAIGVDVGATKVLAGALRGAEVLEALERPTDASAGEAVVAGVEAAVAELAARHGPIAGVGVGLPSQIDFATGCVIASVNLPLADVPLRDRLADRLGLPVHVDNDANCAALGEAALGEDGPIGHLVLLTLGTGVGGGVVIGGRTFRGAHGLGAELGHLVIDRDGPECPGDCPNRGCLEALCSGQALAREAEALTRRDMGSRIAELAAERGVAPGSADLVAAAREGDPAALDAFDRFGTYLGVALSGLVNVFEPEVIAIGGGLSRVADLFLARAEAEAASRALPALLRHVTIRVARSGVQAGMIGAARLVATEDLGPGTPGAEPPTR